MRRFGAEVVKRWAKRVDENQADVVKELRSYGVTVQSLAEVGGGCPDILCGWMDQSFVFEIKNPEQPKSGRKLTRDEDQWIKAWRGQVAVIETAEEALRIMGVIE